jgi:16S rRNA (uracil1498-N3)-methyltransferase
VAKGWAARVQVETGLTPGGRVELTPGQAHHLRAVLRLAPGADVAAFNAGDGEWLCRLVDLARNSAGLVVERQLRAAEPDPDLWLLFAPLKRARLDWLVEKATELGVSVLLPVWTAHTAVGRLNLDRVRAIAVAAAEQCERLTVPEARAPQALQQTLAGWPARRPLIACDESGGGEPIGEALRRLPAGPAAVLIGPEGGFAETELDALGKLPFVSRVGLGPRVLRAETAAVAVLAVYQAIAGDWRHTRPR